MERNCGNCEWMVITEQMQTTCMHTTVKLERLGAAALASCALRAGRVDQVEPDDLCRHWSQHPVETEIGYDDGGEK